MCVCVHMYYVEVCFDSRFSDQFPILSHSLCLSLRSDEFLSISFTLSLCIYIAGSLWLIRLIMTSRERPPLQNNVHCQTTNICTDIRTHTRARWEADRDSHTDNIIFHSTLVKLAQQCIWQLILYLWCHLMNDSETISQNTIAIGNVFVLDVSLLEIVSTAHVMIGWWKIDIVFYIMNSKAFV